MEFLDPFRSASHWAHVVIPYNYADHEFAYKLAGALRRDRVTPWIDEVDMSAGVFLVNRIAQAARPVDFVVPAISAFSVTSSWVQNELRTAMTRSFNGRHVMVLPARIDGSALPPYLAPHPYLDFHGVGWSRAYDEFLTAIQRHARPGLTMRPSPAARRLRPLGIGNPLLRRRWGK